MHHLEFRGLMEYMGLTYQWLTPYLKKDDRTVRRYIGGQLKVPEHVATTMRALHAEFHAQLVDMVSDLRTYADLPDGQVIQTFAKDEAYTAYQLDRDPDAVTYPSRWHRHLAIHALQHVPTATITAAPERAEPMISMQDIRDQVTASLTEYVAEHDVDAVAEAIYDTYGRVNIDSIDHDEYWNLVARHATD